MGGGEGRALRILQSCPNQSGVHHALYRDSTMPFIWNVIFYAVKKLKIKERLSNRTYYFSACLFLLLINHMTFEALQTVGR